MFNRSFTFFAIMTLFMICCVACSSGEAQKNTTSANATAAAPTTGAPESAVEPKVAATPRINFTAADIAKLKWIVGTWRGMDGQSPFYERYKLEGTSLVVETLKEDGSPDVAPSRFELKNGEFGRTEGNIRSAASEITDTYVQFVPAGAGKPGSMRNSFRFQAEDNGTWTAILKWSDADGKPQEKVYKMEPWKPEK